MIASVRREWQRLASDALADRGRRRGSAREQVVDSLARQDCCRSASEIADVLRGRGHPVGLASVYRTLDLLGEAGLLATVELGDGPIRYEPLLPDGPHHHHVLCQRCGRVTPFEDPALERAIARLAGRLSHRVSAHDVLIRGACDRCLSA